jgi:hypothetical protein
VLDKENLAMRGRYVETVVTKKRASSRDFINAYDREESSGILILIISFFLSFFLSIYIYIYIYCCVCDLIRKNISYWEPQMLCEYSYLE